MGVPGEGGQAGTDLLAVMAGLARDAAAADFTLICEGVRRPVHTFVLKNRSPFFETALARWSGKERQMDIKECSVEVLDMVINYMYGINIHCKEENLEELLDISERLQILDLKAEVGRFTAQTIHLGNYKELCMRADRYNCRELAEAAIHFMVTHSIQLEWEEARQAPSMAVAYLNMLIRQNMEKEKERARCIKAGCEYTAQYCCNHYN